MDLDGRQGAPEAEADAQQQAGQEAEMALRRDAHRIARERLSEQNAVEPGGDRDGGDERHALLQELPFAFHAGHVVSYPFACLRAGAAFKASDPKMTLHFWDYSDAFLLNESIVDAENRGHFSARCFRATITPTAPIISEMPPITRPGPPGPENRPTSNPA